MMQLRSSYHYFIFLLLFLVVQTSCADPNRLLADKIEALVQANIPQVNFSALLLEAESGNILYQRNANQYFTPGSTLKLLTAAASLLELGEDYRFETTAKIKAETLHHNTLNGDLYLSFNGDPSLSSEDLNQLILQIKSKGISHITGDIMIDDSRFKPPVYAMGWTVDALPWYYAAPVTSIILNENKVKIMFTPNATLGEKTIVSLADGESAEIMIKADVMSVSPETAETECQFQASINEENTLNLNGCWPYQEKPRLLNVAIKNPYALLTKNLLSALKTHQITFQGTIKKAAEPKALSLSTVAIHYSAPLNKLLKPVLQDSNNLYSDSLIKLLGFTRFQQGTFQAGTRAIKEILKEKGAINIDDTLLFDGSGLSRYNLITPIQIASLLETVWKNPILKQSFMEVLPIAGQTGTLSARFKSVENSHVIHAKTGTLSGVSALAGYMDIPKNKPLIFVMIINNYLQPQETIRQFEEKLCALMIESMIHSTTLK